jgi:hypothetical protein
MKKERLINLLILFSPERGSGYSTSIPKILAMAMLDRRPTYDHPHAQSKAIFDSYVRCLDLNADETLNRDNDYEDEICQVCSGFIPFEDFTAARCVEGHPFGKIPHGGSRNHDEF